MDLKKLDALFVEYENAFNNLDMEPIAQKYADSFISAGPKGVIAQNKEQFLAMSKQAGDMYRSLGQNSARIISKKIIPISNEYAMVTVHWGVTFEKTGNRLIEFDVSYIVQQLDETMQIILFISHEDEEEAMRELGLKP